MGIKHPPYNLRTNKAVDRILLAKVLRKFDFNEKGCGYYSLAGPFLEDLRVIDHYLPEMKLTSIESDKNTYLRQIFNRFNSSISFINREFGDFLFYDYVPSDRRDVFWLDFSKLKYHLFEEFQNVLKKVPPGSIVKITLRAEPEINLRTLEDRVSNEEMERFKNELEEKFNNEFQKVLSNPVAGAFSSQKDFAKMVQLMIRNASSLALDYSGSEIDYLPIQAMRYNDGTQMLSVTGIVHLRDQTEINKIKKTIESCNNSCIDWEEPKEINIPNLSIKERLRLEHFLPVQEGFDSGEVLYKELNYCIDETEKLSKCQFSRYAEFYREYPNFMKTSI